MWLAAWGVAPIERQEDVHRWQCVAEYAVRYGVLGLWYGTGGCVRYAGLVGHLDGGVEDIVWYLAAQAG